jgi:hypothetical protein
MHVGWVDLSEIEKSRRERKLPWSGMNRGQKKVRKGRFIYENLYILLRVGVKKAHNWWFTITIHCTLVFSKNITEA